LNRENTAQRPLAGARVTPFVTPVGYGRTRGARIEAVDSSASGVHRRAPQRAVRVRVYAGQDPVGKRRHYLTEIIPSGPQDLTGMKAVRGVVDGVAGAEGGTVDPTTVRGTGPAAVPCPGRRQSPQACRATRRRSVRRWRCRVVRRRPETAAATEPRSDLPPVYVTHSDRSAARLRPAPRRHPAPAFALRPRTSPPPCGHCSTRPCTNRVSGAPSA